MAAQLCLSSLQVVAGDGKVVAEIHENANGLQFPNFYRLEYFSKNCRKLLDKQSWVPCVIFNLLLAQLTNRAKISQR
ncbi:unnamed protein product [Dracunculus medinensis]|uniref:Uncharacterized protein n=1 Tax=Dracunculus medinensis TaxID=318479 RepID=A0A0N4U8J2_DRAME|nr:unnamed protein product [Dracunculus medinensis]